ncbi:MAG: hypothetical protein A2022_03825 [Deltaproteobacteria bacterium GWF2_42_12]|nr:MAG: hypothetical protein A2022_03825 [Deltaproteobacteria bacterium GWF2_42_12]OGQ30293.1 MAG: hypothetical protein A3D29_03835 [Deltaproteobacteria bacterium RIFCSPHIGHO2_02_FULL_42_44]
MPKRASQAEHDSMVEFLADALYGRDMKDVTADIPGYKRPQTITLPGYKDGHTPDVTAYDGNQLIIYEVETADSINDPHTEEQWKLFAEYALQNNAVFYVTVPPMEIASARKRVKELNLDIKVVTVP